MAVPRTTALLKVLANNEQPADTRADAAKELGRMKAKEAVPGLLAALRYGPPQITRAAATALGNIGDKSAAMGLCKYLEEVQPFPMETREAVYSAIVKLDNPETFKYLFDAARISQLPGDRTMAGETLDKMMGTDFVCRHSDRTKWVKRNRPEWKKYFAGKVGAAAKFNKFSLFYVIGIGIAIVVGWFVWARIL
jgi:hypothetical protein